MIDSSMIGVLSLPRPASSFQEQVKGECYDISVLSCVGDRTRAPAINLLHSAWCVIINHYNLITGGINRYGEIKRMPVCARTKAVQRSLVT